MTEREDRYIGARVRPRRCQRLCTTTPPVTIPAIQMAFDVVYTNHELGGPNVTPSARKGSYPKSSWVTTVI